jgi:hypothetical protein
MTAYDTYRDALASLGYRLTWSRELEGIALDTLECFTHPSRPVVFLQLAAGEPDDVVCYSQQVATVGLPAFLR